MSFLTSGRICTEAYFLIQPNSASFPYFKIFIRHEAERKQIWPVAKPAQEKLFEDIHKLQLTTNYVRSMQAGI